MQNDQKKRFEYDRQQNIMRKMHEEIVRDKGLYIIPATNIGNSTSLLPNGLLNSATSNKRPQGYKIPRKFTLESLGKMDYRDFGEFNLDSLSKNLKIS